MTTTSPTSIHIFTIQGMHCGSCALLFDDALQDLPGVHETHTSASQQRTTVQLDPTRTSSQDVINAITELGYRAQPAHQP